MHSFAGFVMARILITSAPSLFENGGSIFISELYRHQSVLLSSSGQFPIAVHLQIVIMVINLSIFYASSILRVPGNACVPFGTERGVIFLKFPRARA